MSVASLEHRLRRPLCVHGQAAVQSLVDGGHQPELRVEAVERAAVVLTPRGIDDRRRALAPPPASPTSVASPRDSSGGAQLGGRARRAASGRATARTGSLPVTPPVASPSPSRSTSPSRCPDANGAHPVLGERPGLVGADDRRRPQSLDGAEPLDDARPRRDRLADADGERQRERRQKSFGNVGDDQADGEGERVLRRQSRLRASRWGGTRRRRRPPPARSATPPGGPVARAGSRLDRSARSAPRFARARCCIPVE